MITCEHSRRACAAPSRHIEYSRTKGCFLSSPPSHLFFFSTISLSISRVFFSFCLSPSPSLFLSNYPFILVSSVSLPPSFPMYLWTKETRRYAVDNRKMRFLSVIVRRCSLRISQTHLCKTNGLYNHRSRDETSAVRNVFLRKRCSFVTFETGSLYEQFLARGARTRRLFLLVRCDARYIHSYAGDYWIVDLYGK